MDDDTKKYTCERCGKNVLHDDIVWNGIDTSYPNRNTIKVSDVIQHKNCGGIVKKLINK